MNKRALSVLAFGSLAAAALMATGAEAAPYAFSCPDVLGPDQIVIDLDTGEGQIVGTAMALRSPNYPRTMKALTDGTRLFVVAPETTIGGGPAIPGNEAWQLRIDSGNLVAMEYASERVIGACTPVDSIPLATLTIPEATGASPVSLACIPFDTSAPAPEQWTPVPANTFTLTFEGGKVQRQETAGATPTEVGSFVADDGHKIVFAAQAGGSGPGFALNRYTGNLFETTDLGYLPGRLVAACSPSGGPA
jgi:hypothetical protein